MSRESTMERLLREKAELASVIVAYDNFHAALDRYHNTAYKGDALKALEAARNAMKQARAGVEPILKGEQP